MENERVKLCLNCEATKSVSAFSKDKTRKDGLSPYCKDCRKIYQRDYAHKNKDKLGDQHRLYVASNPEKQAKWNQTYRNTHPDRVKGSRTAYYKANRDEINNKRNQRNRDNPELVLWRGAKIRAEGKGLPFDITVEDIFIPDICPILGIPLVVGTGKLHDGSPSLDRKHPELGYVKGNVAVLSHKANAIKNNGTAKQHRRIADWMET